MARLQNDLFNIATGLWKALPDDTNGWELKAGIVITAATGVLTLTNSFGSKVIRILSRDATPYVCWNDLEGQIDRLANDRFDALKGALAPAAIYDRKGVVGDVFGVAIKGVKSLDKKGVTILTGTALLALATLSLHQCNNNGNSTDPATAEQCLNLLGQHFKEPSALAALSLGYTLSGGITPMILGGVLSVGLTFMITRSVSSGFSSRLLPTLLRKQELLLKERYEGLGKHLTAQWENAVVNQDDKEKERLRGFAEKIKRRGPMISLAFEEFFGLSDSTSVTTMSPLNLAASKIIEQSALLDQKVINNNKISG